jgi:hypothetical protein
MARSGGHPQEEAILSFMPSFNTGTRSSGLSQQEADLNNWSDLVTFVKFRPSEVNYRYQPQILAILRGHRIRNIRFVDLSGNVSLSFIVAKGSYRYFS